MCHENNQAKLIAGGQDPGTKGRVCINSGGSEITCAETTWKGIYAITKNSPWVVTLSCTCQAIIGLWFLLVGFSFNSGKTRQMLFVVSQQEHTLKIFLLKKHFSVQANACMGGGGLGGRSTR